MCDRHEPGDERCKQSRYYQAARASARPRNAPPPNVQPRRARQCSLVGTHAPSSFGSTLGFLRRFFASLSLLFCGVKFERQHEILKTKPL